MRGDRLTLRLVLVTAVLARALVHGAPAAAQAIDLSGQYTSEWGNTTFTQQGASVSGNWYQPQGSGTCRVANCVGSFTNGRLSGTTLDITWKNGWDSWTGSMRCTVSGGGTRLACTYDTVGGSGGPWTFQRVQPVQSAPQATQPPRPTATTVPPAQPPPVQAIQPAPPPISGVGYRLVEVLWQDFGTGVKDGTNTIRWLQAPDSRGGRIEVTVDSTGNLMCQGQLKQTFTLGWSFDRDVSFLAVGDTFRMTPTNAYSTQAPVCRDQIYWQSTGDFNGSLISAIRQVRDVGTGPGAVFHATEGNVRRFYAPSRPADPAAVAYVVEGIHQPNRAFFQLSLEAWGNVAINVLYVYELTVPPVAAPPVVATAPIQPSPGVGDYRLIDIIWQDFGTGVADGTNTIRWLQEPSAQMGILEVTMDNTGNLICQGQPKQTFVLGWTFDRDISWLSFGDTFRLTPANGYYTAAPVCRDNNWWMTSGDYNGSLISGIRQVRDVGTGPGGAFNAVEGNVSRFHAPAWPDDLAGTTFALEQINHPPDRAFFIVDLEAWGNVAVEVLYLYERVDSGEGS